MSLRKQPRQPEQLGSLALFSALDEWDGVRSLQDLERQQAALEKVRHGLTASLGNEARLHGWRVQALFEALVVELGAVQMVKIEDEGDLYYEGEGEMKLPDFRLAVAGSPPLLVEVKNVDPENLTARIAESELDALERYGVSQGARLLIAHYWAKGNMWTLVDAGVLDRDAGSARIELPTAMKANEFRLLGDAMLATTPPLTLRLQADPEKSRWLGPEREGEREAQITIAATAIVAGGRRITDPVEQRIASALMFFGGWDFEQTLASSGERIEGIDLVFRPAEPPEDANTSDECRIVASLSSIYSASFNHATLNAEGRVAGLRREPDPGSLGGLVPADYWGRQDRQLRLWRFELFPSLGPQAVDRQPR
jgi:hypothetical protein